MRAHGEEYPVLWKGNSVSDCHTADSFLQRLVLNATVRQRSYWQVVRDAQAVSLQLSVVLSCVEVFFYLLNDWASPSAVLAATLFIIVAGQVLIRLVAGLQLGGSMLRATRQSALLLTGVYLLSPLYSTLARAISDDTIVAASTWLLLAHLYMHDYHFAMSVAARLTGSLSIAAGTGAALLLASRLRHPDDVFSHIVFSLAVFVVFPFICRHLRQLSAAFYSVVVAAMACVTAYMLRSHPWQWMAVYVVTHVGLVFLCPWCLLSIGKFKAQINGPWDEAVPQLSATLAFDDDDDDMASLSGGRS